MDENSLPFYSELSSSELSNCESQIDRLRLYFEKCLPLLSEDILTIHGSPLIGALKYSNDISIIQEFINHCGDIINAKSRRRGNTALHYAVLKLSTLEHYEIFKLLLRKGSDINITNNSTETPLCALMASAHENKFKYFAFAKLIYKGEIKNINDIKSQTSGDSALHIAVSPKISQYNFVEFLLKMRANVNAKNNKKETPLSVSVRTDKKCFVKNYTIIEILLKYGAMPDLNLLLSLNHIYKNFSGDEKSFIHCQKVSKLLIKYAVLKDFFKIAKRKNIYESIFYILLNSESLYRKLSRLPDLFNCYVQFCNECFNEMTLIRDEIGLNCPITKLTISLKSSDVLDKRKEMSDKDFFRILHVTDTKCFYYQRIRHNAFKHIDLTHLNIYLSSRESEDALNTDCLTNVAKYLSKFDLMNLILASDNILGRPKVIPLNVN